MSFFSPDEIKDPIMIAMKVYNQAGIYFETEAKKTTRELLSLKPELERYSSEQFRVADLKYQETEKKLKSELDAALQKKRDEITVALTKQQFAERRNAVAELKRQHESTKSHAAVYKEQHAQLIANLNKKFTDDCDRELDAYRQREQKLLEENLLKIKEKLHCDALRLIGEYRNKLKGSGMFSLRQLGMTVINPGTSVSYRVRKECMTFADVLMSAIFDYKSNYIEKRTQLAAQQLIAKIMDVIEHFNKNACENEVDAKKEGYNVKNNFFNKMLLVLKELQLAYPQVYTNKTMLLAADSVVTPSAIMPASVVRERRATL